MKFNKKGNYYTELSRHTPVSVKIGETKAWTLRVENRALLSVFRWYLGQYKYLSERINMSNKSRKKTTKRISYVQYISPVNIMVYTG